MCNQYKLSRDHFTDTKVKEAGNKNQVSLWERPSEHSNCAGLQHFAYRKKRRDTGSVVLALPVLDSIMLMVLHYWMLPGNRKRWQANKSVFVTILMLSTEMQRNILLQLYKHTLLLLVLLHKLVLLYGNVQKPAVKSVKLSFRHKKLIPNSHLISQMTWLSIQRLGLTMALLYTAGLCTAFNSLQRSCHLHSLMH